MRPRLDQRKLTQQLTKLRAKQPAPTIDDWRAMLDLRMGEDDEYR